MLSLQRFSTISLSNCRPGNGSVAIAMLNAEGRTSLSAGWGNRGRIDSLDFGDRLLGIAKQLHQHLGIRPAEIIQTIQSGWYRHQAVPT